MRKEAQKAVGRAMGRIVMPCYREPAFWKAIAHLPEGRTPLQLERWLGRYARVVRCPCGACEGMPDWKLDGGRGEDKPQSQERVGSASVPVAGTSPIGGSGLDEFAHLAGLTGTADDTSAEDKAPPEEEEGVEENLPTQETRKEVSSVPVLNPEIITSENAEDIWNAPAEALSAFDVDWTEWLESELLFPTQAPSNGGLGQSDTSPDGMAKVG